MPSPPLRYRLLILFLSPWLFLVTIWQGWRRRSKRFVVQRLGLSTMPVHGKPLWIHCASVGEVNAAIPLIKRLREIHSSLPIIVSTTTAGGAEVVSRHTTEFIQHRYLPIDFRRAVSKFVTAIDPRALVLMETEIWPNLITEAKRAGLPVVVVNGRLTEKSLLTPDWTKVIFRQSLSQIDQVFAKSPSDAEAFVTLGCDPERVEVIGNIKYAIANNVKEKTRSEIDREYWLVASTHDDEESQLCAQFTNFEHCGNMLMVLVPRHPNRSDDIQTMLQKLGLRSAVRSKGELVRSDTQVYLADRLGEMQMWMDHAQVVFMGGSLVPVGGHNLLEPAVAGVPIVSGSYLDNCREDAELLSSVGALQVANNSVEALQKIDALLAQPESAKKAGKAGFTAVMQQTDVLEDYVSALQTMIQFD